MTLQNKYFKYFQLLGVGGLALRSCFPYFRPSEDVWGETLSSTKKIADQMLADVQTQSASRVFEGVT